MTLRAPAVVPPTVLSDAPLSILTPAPPLLGTAFEPWTLVPIKLPVTTLPVVPVPVISTPLPMLPEITLAEIVLLVAAFSMFTPLPPLAAAALPAALKPIKSSVIVTFETPTISTPSPPKLSITSPLTVLPEAVMSRPTADLPALAPLRTMTGGARVWWNTRSGSCRRSSPVA